MWRSEDSLSESLVFFCHVGSVDQPQAVRLGCKCPYPHLTGPKPAPLRCSVRLQLCGSHPVCPQALGQQTSDLDSFLQCSPHSVLGPCGLDQGREKDGLCVLGTLERSLSHLFLHRDGRVSHVRGLPYRELRWLQPSYLGLVHLHLGESVPPQHEPAFLHHQCQD